MALKIYNLFSFWIIKTTLCRQNVVTTTAHTHSHSHSHRYADIFFMFKRNCGFSHKVFIALMLLMMSIYSHSALSMCCANILPFSHTHTHRGSTRSHRVRWDSETAHIVIWHDMRHTILLYLFRENICDMNSFWRGLYLHHVLMNMRKSLIYLMFVCGCLSAQMENVSPHSME